jgi:glycosyltransferase involved in cell wall biosynthesis
VVSRLEYYKKVDLVVDAFNELGLPLIIVGRGSKEMELKKRAKSNIGFKNGLNNHEISELYAGCKALIFPQHEDYGITPLEANASGRPVIAFGKGGVLETMIPKVEKWKATALFFEDQSVESLVAAINAFNDNDFDPFFIRRHAEKFNEDKFVKQIRNHVLNLYEIKTSNTKVEANLQAVG